MELSKIDKASKILGAVKKLDGEIIQIDKIAMLIANDGGDAEFELTVKEHKKPEDEKAAFDNDGSLIPQKTEDIIKKYATGLWFSWQEPIKTTEDDKSTTIKNILSPTNTLAILGVLLRDKTEKRAILINKLEKMGFKI